MESKNPLKVHLYKVSIGEKSKDLVDVVKSLASSPIHSRSRKLAGRFYRLEDCVEPTKENPFWLLDFTKMRYEGGPGRASASKAIQSFDMEWDGFAEETAVLYDPSSGFAAIQYNHHGPRVGAISEYLSIVEADAPNDYSFMLRLNDAAQARLEKKKIFTRFKVRVAPARLSEEFRKANVSLTSALEAQTKLLNGDYAIIEIGLDRESAGVSLGLSKMIDVFKKMAGEERNAVDTLVISGRDDEDAVIDPVDLIAERLEFAFKNLKLDDGLRIVREERYNALQRAYRAWKRVGVI